MTSSERRVFLKLSPSDGHVFPGSTTGDLLLYTSQSNQKIFFGNDGNAPSMVLSSSSDLKLGSLSVSTSSNGDLMLYTATSNQQIMLGTNLFQDPRILVTSESVRLGSLVLSNDTLGRLTLSSSASNQSILFGTNAVQAGSLIVSNNAASELILSSGQSNQRILIGANSNIILSSNAAQVLNLSLSNNATFSSSSNFYWYRNNQIGMHLDQSSALWVTGDVTAFASDARLKENVKKLEEPLKRLAEIDGVTFDWREEIKQYGCAPAREIGDVGVLAQQVQRALPEAVRLAPFDRTVDSDTGEATSRTGMNYLTVQYEKIVPLLIEGVKELALRVASLEASLSNFGPQAA